MLSPRTRRNLLVALIAILALLIAFLLWWFLRPEPAAVPVAVPTEEVTPVPVSRKPTISSDKQAREQQARTEGASLQTAAKTFAERYGSYSTEANFANLTDVLPLMTVAFAAQTSAYVASATPPAGYYAVTTRAVTVSVDAEDEAAGTASVTVTAQREETKETVQNVSVRYQELVLTFEMEGDVWKVSSATWR